VNWRAGWELIRDSAREFSDDEAMPRAAALAFYTALGLAPTVLLFLSVAAFLGEDIKQDLVNQMETMVGGEGARGIEMVVRHAESKPQAGVLSAVVGFLTVLFSASGIFAELQTTLNRIWNVKRGPNAGTWNWVKVRLLSVGTLLSVLFLLLVSLVLSAALSALLERGALWGLVDLAASILLYVLLFALIYKMLPDVEISWRDVWVGAALTAALFAVGKYFIGLYLGKSGLASGYGAAGSLVALLAWVYYSALIVLFGAEVTQVYAKRWGSGIRPAPGAVAEDESPKARRGDAGVAPATARQVQPS
jgi:membrane protein